MDKWRKLRLIDEKQNVLLPQQPISKEIHKREGLLLLGFVVADKLINKEALKNMMKGVWKLQGKVDFKDVVNNLFLIEFFKALDMLKVKGRP